MIGDGGQQIKFDEIFQDLTELEGGPAAATFERLNACENAPFSEQS